MIVASSLPRHADPPEVRLEHFYRGLFYGLLLALAASLIAWAVYAVLPTGQQSYLESQGIPGSLPLSALAAFMTVTWLPMFMPALLPVVVVVIGAWFFAVGLVYGSRY